LLQAAHKGDSSNLANPEIQDEIITKFLSALKCPECDRIILFKLIK